MSMTAIPPDFLAALKSGGIDTFFAECTPAHQREYIKWISEAKKPETRKVRIEKAAKMLAEKRAQEAAHSKRHV
jgi:uncharacterized protein YdeI (YjbR/CyaY-like superfamily)